MAPMKFSRTGAHVNGLIAAAIALNVLFGTISVCSTHDRVSRALSPDTPQRQDYAFQKNHEPPPNQLVAPQLAPELATTAQSTPQKTTEPLSQEILHLQPVLPHQAAQQAANNTGNSWTNNTVTNPSDPNRLSVLTTSARYLGFTTQSPNSVDTWLGVRYAKPPLGDLRFRAPVLLDTNQEDDGQIQLAHKFGDTCPQKLSGNPSDPVISEDCLHLNVYRPSDAAQDSLLPVLVWIHGGAYTYGSGAATDGAVLVSSSCDLNKPIIFVTINFRLNSFGFLNTDDLPVDDLQVGLQDQIICLKWLNLNIKAFGGDPDKITLWGQSSGAIAVATLVTYLYGTPGATLFRAAIMDSGSPTSHTVPAVNVYDRPGMPYTLLLNGTGCDTAKTAKRARRSWRSDSPTTGRLECLRELDYEVLLNATLKLQGTLPFSRQVSVWGPSYKAGSLIDRRPCERLNNGCFMKIPMLIGTNKDEGTRTVVGPSMGYNVSLEDSDAFFYSYMTNSSVLDLQQIDSEVYNNVAQLYPDDPSLGSPFDTGSKTFGLPQIFKRLAAWFGDLHYQAPKRLWALKASPYSPVYVYYFDGPPASNGEPHDGVPHASELPLILGNINEKGLPVSEVEETKALAERIRNSYISFVHELNPGDDWPAYTPQSQMVMRFNKGIIQGELIQDNWRAEQLDYLNSQPAIDTYMT